MATIAKLWIVALVVYYFAMCEGLEGAGDSSLERRLQNMETKLDNVDNNLNLLAETSKRSTYYRDSLLSQLDVLTDMLRRQKYVLDDIKKSTESNGGSTLPPASYSPVVFTAYLDYNMGSTKVDTPVVYNKVILNEGGAYDNVTGVFTCPRSGIYDFFFSVGQRDVNDMWAKLLVNYNLVVDAAADTTETRQDVQGGNRAFVRLNKGDTVMVQMYYDSTHLQGAMGRFTTFSGMFVAP